MKFNSVDEILDFAIEKEDEAAKFYIDLASKSKPYEMRQVFQDFSREEMGHKDKLLAIKKGKLLMMPSKKVMDLKIAEQVEEVRPTEELTYQQALILAMKREKASFKLYSTLAGATDDDGVRGTLLMLAQEEAKHKLRFEIEYDENVFKEG